MKERGSCIFFSEGGGEGAAEIEVDVEREEKAASIFEAKEVVEAAAAASDGTFGFEAY